jgi:hypothetical protein
MKKLGILCLTLVLALAGMGVGYAHWSQTLKITEEVTSGKFCMEFDVPWMIDTSAPPPVFPGDPPDYNAEPNFVRVYQVDKDVGWGEVVMTDPFDDPHYAGLKITLHDVYPGYYNHAYYVIHNCGTIPAWLPYVIVKDCTGQEIARITADGEIVTMDLDGNGTPDFQILYGNHIGPSWQYNPSQRIDISFEMLVLQDNDPNWQGNKFCFYLELPFVQYNYAP